MSVKRTSTFLSALVLGGLLLSPAAYAGFKAKKASNAELIACLSEQSDDVKRDCMNYIAEKGVTEAADALVALVADGETKVVRAHAMGTLEKLAVPQAVPAAIAMAKGDSEPQNRSKALVVLQKLAAESDGAPVVIDRMANDQDPDVRRKAMSVAKKVEWAGMEQAMIDHGLSDGDPLVKRDALYGLLAIESQLARPAIYAATQGLPEAERTSVIRVWAKNVLPSDVPFLVECLDDSDDDVAIYAARALVAHGDASVAPTLREKGKAHGGARKDELKDAAKTLEKGE